MIELQHVTKTYAGGVHAVSDLSLAAPTGKITALVGPSGCGKTTMLRMINRLIEPTSGAVLLDGEDVTSGSKVELRRRIGYVIQNAGLMPHRRVIDNVLTVPRLLGHPKAAARERAQTLLQMVGLDASFAQKFPAQLSGGQSQRVGVARALAADPPFLLMDEPFSAVDPVVRKQLQQEFLSLQRTVAKTIVIVTHDIDEALLLGDQIVVLGQAARIEQRGTPHELLTRPASEFVSHFLGRGRGYHALSFEPAAGLELQSTPAAGPADDAAGSPSAPSDGITWQVVVDAERRPVHWRRGREQRPLEAVDPDRAVLRACLDAALTGPDHRGVAVDPSGAYRGTFTAEAVVRRAATTAPAPVGAP